jgi:hypothetical protein
LSKLNGEKECRYNERKGIYELGQYGRDGTDGREATERRGRGKLGPWLDGW